MPARTIPLNKPRNSLTIRVAPRYQRALRTLETVGRWNAPFQFTIPVMAAMWLDLQKDWISRRAPDWLIHHEKGTGRPVLQLEEYWKGYWKDKDGRRKRNLPWGSLDPVLKRKGRGRVRHALECPIRAIAFFSWEESGRVFLARRVFPTYFNFLSYSHCPEGWGALGRMVKELKTSESAYFSSRNHGLTIIDKFSQSALPFLSEVKRLEYKAIYVIPIIKKWGRFSTTHDLMGGFVVFVGKRSALPAKQRSGRDVLTQWLKKTNQQVVAILKEQDKLFRRTPLESLWRKQAKKLGRRSPERGVFELTISEGPRAPNRLDLRKVVSNLIASLSTSEFHAILDGTNSDKAKNKDNVVVLIAKTEHLPGIERIKAAILRAVGEACELKPDRFIVRIRKL